MWAGIIKFFPPREGLVCDIPDGEREYRKLFFSVYIGGSLNVVFYMVHYENMNSEYKVHINPVIVNVSKM
jgi:hypothetical protein